jgi:hypothetical protein
MDAELLAPVKPANIEQTGLEFNFLADLVLKLVYADANCTTERVSQRIKLPMSIADPLLQHLYRERLVEIRGQIERQNYRYAMLDRGWERVGRLLEISGYIGPAPVSLSAYTAWIRDQEKQREPIDPEQFDRAFSELVLADEDYETLQLVASSRRSLFMTGAAGNGKTSIAKALHAARAGEIWIPYAIEIDDQVIKVFDTHNHQPVNGQSTDGLDQRWIRIRRPLVIVGGELTIEAMDLIYSPIVRYYEAPFQIKSNGGTLVIDDFGRQRVDPKALLNRWIIPLESHVDYLTLHTGKKIEVPFEQALIFSTNLDPKNLVDEAFLRRMGYRLQVQKPGREQYANIFRRYAGSLELAYDPSLIGHLLQRYAREQRDLRCCEPRDLLERCMDICRYENRPAVLTEDLMGIAWRSYFGDEDH